MKQVHYAFWKDVKKNTNPNVSLSTNADRSFGETEIEMC